jgi:Domain of unknown function (DUF4440)
MNLEIADEQFFRTLECRRTSALVQQDLPAIEALHAPEYQLIAPSGRVFTREHYISAIAQEPFYTEWEIANMACRITEDMAIVRYHAKLRFPEGKEVFCWHTDSYEKRAGQWQAVWSQATETQPPLSLG